MAFSDYAVWGLRGAAILSIVYAILSLSQRSYQISLLYLSPLTLAIISLLYLVAEISMTQSRMGKLDAVVASLVFAFAYVQAFELLFHFTFPVYLNYLRPISLSGSQIKYLVVMAVPIAPVILFRKHLSFKWTSGVFLAAFVVIWAVWILCGYPQCTGDSYYYPRVLAVTNACNTSVLLTVSSKITLGALFGSLLDYGMFFMFLKHRGSVPKVSV